MTATDSWTYDVATTWRPQNNSTNNRVNFVIGVNETLVNFLVSLYAKNSHSTYNMATGIGLDATNANHAQILRSVITVADVRVWLYAEYRGHPGIGFHYLQALEYIANGTATFYGDNADVGIIISGGSGSLIC